MVDHLIRNIFWLLLFAIHCTGNFEGHLASIGWELVNLKPYLSKQSITRVEEKNSNLLRTLVSLKPHLSKQSIARVLSDHLRVQS